MDVLSGNISSMVFKQVVTGGTGEITLDSSFLHVFMGLDGKKNLGIIAQETGLIMGEIRDAISRLLHLKLSSRQQRIFCWRMMNFLIFSTLNYHLP